MCLGTFFINTFKLYQSTFNVKKVICDGKKVMQRIMISIKLTLINLPLAAQSNVYSFFTFFISTSSRICQFLANCVLIFCTNYLASSLPESFVLLCSIFFEQLSSCLFLLTRYGGMNQVYGKLQFASKLYDTKMLRCGKSNGTAMAANILKKQTAHI